MGATGQADDPELIAQLPQDTTLLFTTEIMLEHAEQVEIIIQQILKMPGYARIAEHLPNTEILLRQEIGAHRLMASTHAMAMLRTVCDPKAVQRVVSSLRKDANAKAAFAADEAQRALENSPEAVSRTVDGLLEKLREKLLALNSVHAEIITEEKTRDTQIQTIARLETTLRDEQALFALAQELAHEPITAIETKTISTSASRLVAEDRPETLVIADNTHEEIAKVAVSFNRATGEMVKLRQQLNVLCLGNAEREGRILSLEATVGSVIAQREVIECKIPDSVHEPAPPMASL